MDNPLSGHAERMEGKGKGEKGLKGRNEGRKKEPHKVYICILCQVSMTNIHSKLKQEM
jgi:hypothetical protein